MIFIANKPKTTTTIGFTIFQISSFPGKYQQILLTGIALMAGKTEYFGIV
jgi:hypothetical protein